MNRIAIFTGTAHPTLAQAVCEHFKDEGITLGKALVGRFSDGEIRVQIQQNVRGVDTYIIQPTCAPVNDNLLELLVMTDALKRASASSITAVIPYFGYGRQDRKAESRAPISAKLVADLLSEVIATDTIPLQEAAVMAATLPYLRTTISIAPTLAEAIRRIHHGDSVSSLFV